MAAGRNAMLGRRKMTLLVGASLLSTPVFGQDNKPMTNDDVISLVKAGIGDSTIIAAIRGSRPGFGMGAAALVKLRQAGASDAVISAIIQAEGAKPAQASGGPTRPAAAVSAFNPEEVILIDRQQRQSMHYLVPQLRTAARALGFGGVGQYAVLGGTRATLRLSGNQPEFLVAIPANAQPESYFCLANFAVRSNGTREVMVGGGYMSYSSGVARDRVVQTTSSLADQAAAPSGFRMYRITPAAAMPAGEYAFILYNSQIPVRGFFVSGRDSYFDFGVDR